MQIGQFYNFALSSTNYTCISINVIFYFVDNQTLLVFQFMFKNLNQLYALIFTFFKFVLMILLVV